MADVFQDVNNEDIEEENFSSREQMQTEETQHDSNLIKNGTVNYSDDSRKLLLNQVAKK